MHTSESMKYIKDFVSRKDLGIYVWTSNRNIRCVQAWSYLFNKFWPYKASVRVLGYDLPEFDLPDNFEFISPSITKGFISGSSFP